MSAKILLCILILIELLAGQSNIYVPGEIVARVEGVL